MDNKHGYDPSASAAGGSNYAPSAPPLYPSVPPESSYTVPYGNPPPYQPHTESSYPPPPPPQSTVSYGSANPSYSPHDYRLLDRERQPLQPMVTRTTHRIVHRGEGDGTLTCVGNLLWFTVGGGFIFALAYGFVGLVLCLTIVGIPFGLQLFKLTRLATTAYGWHVYRSPESQTGGTCCCNCLWLPVGVCLAFMHLAYGCAMFCSIIGIPFALAHWRLMTLALWPFGAELSTTEHEHVETVTTTTTGYNSV